MVFLFFHLDGMADEEKYNEIPFHSISHGLNLSLIELLHLAINCRFESSFMTAYLETSKSSLKILVLLHISIH